MTTPNPRLTLAAAGAPALPRLRRTWAVAALAWLAWLALMGLPAAAAATADELLAGYAAAAGAAPQPARGQAFFNTRHGREWSCASCHGNPPLPAGRHASTGKPIAPLAPAANPKRFSNAQQTEKWFRRNCNDVVGRECTAAEKADLLAWLLTLRL